MGISFHARCKNCSTEFPVTQGGGKNTAIIHCDTCGEEKSVSGDMFTDEWPPVLSGASAESCTCGGSFSSSALPRCPEFASDDWEQFDDPDRPGLNWY